MQMLAWNVKFSGTEGEGFVPNFSFHIGLSTLQHAEVKMLGPLYDDHSSIDSHVYMKKQRVLECLVLDIL